MTLDGISSPEHRPNVRAAAPTGSHRMCDGAGIGSSPRKPKERNERRHKSSQISRRPLFAWGHTPLPLRGSSWSPSEAVAMSA